MRIPIIVGQNTKGLRLISSNRPEKIEDNNYGIREAIAPFEKSYKFTFIKP